MPDMLRRRQILLPAIAIETFGNLIIYALIVCGHFAWDYYQKYREREMRSVELEGRLAQAELQNLKMQLHPHFLFNTLHTISVLMMRDANLANRMLIRLSDLLRITLDSTGSHMVPLNRSSIFCAAISRSNRRVFSGVRSYIAEGTTIVTTPAAKTVIERIANMSHVMRPDTLSRNPKAPVIEIIADKRVFDDGVHKVELYWFASPHTGEMIVAYLPNEKILFEADMLDISEGGRVVAGDDTI